MHLSFRFRVVPFIAAVIVAAIGIALGQWQTRRGDEKQAIENLLLARQSAPVLQLEQVPSDAAELAFRRVRLRGSFVHAWPVYLDNRPHDGHAGFYLAMPFRMAASGQHVLVLRGWLPRDVADRTRLPAVETPSGETEIEGVVRSGIGRVMQLGQPEPLRPGAIVQNLDPAELSVATGFALPALVIEQIGMAQDGLVRDWPLPSNGIDKHRGYALQWYGLAALACVFFVVTGLGRGRKQET